MRKLVLGLMGAAALAAGTSANATVEITFTDTDAVPDNNNFQTDLASLGLTRFTTFGAILNLTEDSILTFEVLGTESGFNDTFDAAGGITYTENFPFAVNMFGAPLNIGAGFFSAGDLAGLLNFSSDGPGADATVGDDGFGIFLGANDVSGLLTNVFYIGYDDQIINPDDNHDDLILRVTVSPAIPEPATWAMMLLGFGVVGFAIRRRKQVALTQAA